VQVHHDVIRVTVIEDQLPPHRELEVFRAVRKPPDPIAGRHPVAFGRHRAADRFLAKSPHRRPSPLNVCRGRALKIDALIDEQGVKPRLHTLATDHPRERYNADEAAPRPFARQRWDPAIDAPRRTLKR
jgi:hypothetical protein